MTNDELKKLKDCWEFHRDRMNSEFEELCDYTKSLIDELEEEVELREQLEGWVGEYQDKIEKLESELRIYGLEGDDE